MQQFKLQNLENTGKDPTNIKFVGDLLILAHRKQNDKSHQI